jgi:hypothetical protein
VGRSVNRGGEGGFAAERFRGKAVVLSFLDEARPSQRLLPRLEKLAAAGG